MIHPPIPPTPHGLGDSFSVVDGKTYFSVVEDLDYGGWVGLCLDEGVDQAGWRLVIACVAEVLWRKEEEARRHEWFDTDDHANFWKMTAANKNASAWRKWGESK